MSKPNDLITLREAADLLGVSYATAKRWSADGRMPPPVKIYAANVKRWNRKEIMRCGSRTTASTKTNPKENENDERNA